MPGIAFLFNLVFHFVSRLSRMFLSPNSSFSWGLFHHHPAACAIRGRENALIALTLHWGNGLHKGQGNLTRESWSIGARDLPSSCLS